MKGAGIVLIILALVIGIVPMFTHCELAGPTVPLQSGATTFMKCHWTARAESAVALPLAAAGIAMIISKRRESHRVLAITAGVLGLAAILLPTYLIGVCSSPNMICSMVMRPVLILGGVVTAVASLAVMVRSQGPELAV